MERMLRQMNHPSGRLQAFEQLRRFVHQQRQQQQRQIQQLRAAHGQPATNAELCENRRGIRLTVDLPGVLPGDLNVSHEHGVLTVTASRKHLSLDGVCVKKQKVSRRFAVNTDVVDTDHLTAALAHGVLTVQAPKKIKAARQQEPAGRVSVAAAPNEQAAHEISVVLSSSTAHPGDGGTPPPPQPPHRVATPKMSNISPSTTATAASDDVNIIEARNAGDSSEEEERRDEQ